MLGDRDRPGARWRAALALWATCLGGLAGAACTPSPTGASQSPRTGEPASTAARPPASADVRTANPDRRGFDNQPDYESEAAALREYVDGRLTAPLARDRATACAAMFEAVDAFYASVEYASEARRREVAQALAQSREADLAACTRETSLKAAACVTLLLGDRTAEFPWLLDQCARAYPAA